MYSPKDAKKMLGISATSLRRYGDTFAEFLSKAATEKGRKRKYTEGDITTLQTIRALYQNKRTKDEIRRALSGGTALTTQDNIPLIPAGLTNALSKIDDRFSNQDNRIQRIENDQDHEKELNEAWREYHRELDKWERLGYFERRRTPKPKPPE